MRRFMALAVFALVACSSTSASATHSATATDGSATATAGSTPATPVPSPFPNSSPGAAASLVPDLSLTFPAFACKLPIATPDTAQAAFISVGTMGQVTFVQEMTGVHYYDRAFSKWLPAGREAVSPDGAHYAYIAMRDQGVFFIHIVDVATGADHSYRESNVSGLTAPGILVFDYAPEGVYIVQAFEHIWPGVWLFDPRTNTIRQTPPPAQSPQVSDAGGIWYGDVNASDPNPLLTGTSAGILPDEIFRFDFKTGISTRWWYRPGYGLDVIGLDTSGRPLIEVTAQVSGPQPHTDPIDHAATELVLGLGPNQQRGILKGRLVEYLQDPIADTHGAWFGSTQGIYLYSDANGLQKISNQPGYPANGCF